MNSFIKYFALFFMAMPSAHAVPVEGGELIIRLLLNEGQEGPHKVCTTDEVNLIRTTLIDEVAAVAAANDRRRKLPPVNCPNLCCDKGLAWGTCHVLDPRCYLYPTPSLCDRRLSESNTQNFQIVDDLWNDGGRSLQGEDWEEICSEQKRTAMLTLMGIVPSLTRECEHLALSPTLMSCVFVPSSAP